MTKEQCKQFFDDVLTKLEEETPAEDIETFNERFANVCGIHKFENNYIYVIVKDANHRTDDTGVLSNYVKVYTLDSISLDKTNATLDLSGTKTLKLNAKYGNATIDASQLDWMTSSGTTASVDSTGLVTALKNGTTTITVMKKNSTL